MSATLKMKKWRDNFLQIPEGLRGHPMSELEEVASTLTAIVNMTDDSHIQDMAKFCITEVIAADKEIATRDAELARLREALQRISDGTDAPDIDISGEWQTGLHCGVEDRDCQDRYEGADYGYSQGVERTLEWAGNEADYALKSNDS